MTNKVTKDGHTAVLISSGFGAGWSTWNHSTDCLFTPEIVNCILNDVEITDEMIERLYGPDFYAGGLDQLGVVWVPTGTPFIVDEYDGSESVRTLPKINFIIA